MNDDNDENRRMLEHCFRTNKRIVNPIVDWTDGDVWKFLNDNNIPHCCLYDPPYNYTRIGCIGCPLAGTKQMLRDFELYPKYKELYIRAFQKMIENHPGQIKILGPNSDTKFKLYDEIPENWGGEISKLGQRELLTITPALMAQILLNKTGNYTQAEKVVQIMDGTPAIADSEPKSVSDSSPQTVTDNDIYIYISEQQQRVGSNGGRSSINRMLGEAMFNRWLKVHYC